MFHMEPMQLGTLQGWHYPVYNVKESVSLGSRLNVLCVCASWLFHWGESEMRNTRAIATRKTMDALKIQVKSSC